MNKIYEILKSINVTSKETRKIWSSDFVLDTRESLNRLLAKAGLEDIITQGIEPYPLSNYIQLLLNCKSGCHKVGFSLIDSFELNETCQDAMRKIDVTDTLIAKGEL